MSLEGIQKLEVCASVGNTPSPYGLKEGDEVHIRKGGKWIRVIIDVITQSKIGKFLIFWRAGDGSRGVARHSKVRSVED